MERGGGGGAAHGFRTAALSCLTATAGGVGTNSL